MTTDAPTTWSGPQSSRHRRRRLVALGILLLVPLVAVACGGDEKDATASKNSSNQSQGDFQAYRDCLAKNGVSLPSAPQGQAGEGQQGAPPSIDQQAMQKAQTACSSLQPQGGGFGGGGRNGQAFQDYVSCLSENGVDTSKLAQGGPGGPGGQAPGGQPPSGGQPPTGYGPPSGGQGGAPFGLDSSDPTVAKAMTACQSKLPSGGPGRPGGPGGQGGSTTTTAVTG